MRDIPQKLIIDTIDPQQGAMLDLFEADLTPLGGSLLRFYGGVNGSGQPVTWKGQKYTPYPIKMEGFEMRQAGTYARPTLTVSNLDGSITGINRDFDDAVGMRVVRRQVPVKYLDAVNFTGGNPLADPTQEAVSWFLVEEMTEENDETVTYSLASPVDCDQAVVPGRTILADVCQWVYKGAECGYTGGPVADERDKPTSDAKLDRCSHRYDGCRLRFPRPAVLPISCFPGCEKIR